MIKRLIVDATIPKEPNSIAILLQQEKPRRCPTMINNVIKHIVKSLPTAKMYVFGSVSMPARTSHIEPLGLVEDLSLLRDIYTRCKLGSAFP